jgi:predicted transcriptional regulator
MKYRSRSDIIIVILESTRSGATKTKIMYNTYLSYTQLVKYLEYLQQNDLLEYEKGTHLYRPTEKGLKFLNLSDKLSKMVSVNNSS